MSAPATFTHRLGAALERDRLERRIRRMMVAVGSLRQHASEHRRELGTPRHVRQSIVDFEAQIEAMTARLRDLARERASTQIPATARRR
jgi:hypothetical protein